LSSPGSPFVLFDIDGTLLDCGKASGETFARAFREVYGVACPIFSPAEVAGLTDLAILNQIALRLGVRNREKFEASRERVFEVYARRLEIEFEQRPPVPLPGAEGAVRELRESGCAVGLLTGSTRETARLKLEYAGINPGLFACGAYSEDGERREMLPPAARARYLELFSREPAVTVLVGDTPRDVSAALATSCEFIGVTTGHYSRASLEEAGARIILEDLSNPVALRETVEGLWRME
jgi:phosphoglycolate phosphatase-like HAD superfamily hydrolase